MRSLLYVAIPDWARQECSPSNPLHPHRRRLGIMAATLAAAPCEASTATFEHMFTDNMDAAQRLLALDCFAAAAGELSGEPSLVPLTAAGV
jgi:hypothetical protein